MGGKSVSWYHIHTEAWLPRNSFVARRSRSILALHCLLTPCLFYFIYLTWPIILYVDGQVNLMSIYSPTLVPRI
ncbi:hypothetical protein HZS61_004447 [Fusarium oxysporum f. sp. conglutinans]|uniref:Uncharacterized protein n=1 Tax=Fusarium oxysporum f. sp. conglutinans TaxID=100902 RepID=A0A8H6GDV0_FUSOX|nr:hypothetical protein HZS61_004447 [Fusarium oxysporum f. sp. conglutinans]